MLIRSFASLLFFLVSVTAIAQSNYKEGYIINTNNDTLKGFINYIEWAVNPDVISFKQTFDQVTKQEFSVDNIKYFNIKGHEAYKRFEVSISQNEVILTNITDGSNVTPKMDTVFLKLLLTGDHINLYSYKDKIKTRFYTLDKQEEVPQELGYKTTKSGNTIATVYIYKQQLINLARKYSMLTPELEKSIHVSFYAESDLTKIVDKINPTNKNNLVKKPKEKLKRRPFISAGLNYSSLKYSGQDVVTFDRGSYSGSGIYRREYKDVVTHSYLPKFSVGLDIFRNPDIQQFIFRGEISASLIKSKIIKDYRIVREEEAEYTYKLSALSLAFTPQLIYNFYNSDNFKFYMGTGISFNYSFFAKNTMYSKPYSTDYSEYTTNDYFAMKRYNYNLIIRSGIMLNKKIDISVIWFSPSEITDYTISTRFIKANSLQFNIGYMFNSNKH